MPIFSKTFDVKTVPVRGKRANDDCPVLKENLDDYKSISMNLGQRTIHFQEGHWVQSSGNGAGGDDGEHDAISLRRQIKKLEQTNRLGQIKIDVLLDMLTEQHMNEPNKPK